MDATTTASPCAAASPQYTRRRPEEGLLYRLIDEHLDHFIAMISQDERGLPQRVIDEFRAYLDCGILERGFILRRCLSCNYFHCLGFSCRLRGFCPSCMSKRSAVVAAHLLPLYAHMLHASALGYTTEGAPGQRGKLPLGSDAQTHLRR